MPQRPMLNLENGKCYELIFCHDWDGSYPRKVKIIDDKEVHSETSHSYPTITPSNELHDAPQWRNYFQYVWDHGWAKGSSYGDTSIVEARVLKGAELKEFEAQIVLGKKN